MQRLVHPQSFPGNLDATMATTCSISVTWHVLKP